MNSRFLVGFSYHWASMSKKFLDEIQSVYRYYNEFSEEGHLCREFGGQNPRALENFENFTEFSKKNINFLNVANSSHFHFA